MIVDASVAFKWLALEEDSDLALQLLERDALFAPTFLVVEVANGLWKKAMREEIDSAVSFQPEVDRLCELVTLVNESNMIGRALDIGREIRHAVYDCLYLAVAEASNDLVVTSDAKFINKLSGTAFAHLVLPLREAVSL